MKVTGYCRHSLTSYTWCNSVSGPNKWSLSRHYNGNLSDQWLLEMFEWGTTHSWNCVQSWSHQPLQHRENSGKVSNHNLESCNSSLLLVSEQSVWVGKYPVGAPIIQVFKAISVFWWMGLWLWAQCREYRVVVLNFVPCDQMGTAQFVHGPESTDGPTPMHRAGTAGSDPAMRRWGAWRGGRQPGPSAAIHRAQPCSSCAERRRCGPAPIYPCREKGAWLGPDPAPCGGRRYGWSLVWLSRGLEFVSRRGLAAFGLWAGCWALLI